MNRDSIISEAFDNINNIEKCRNKKLAEGKRNNPVPKPFNKYFEIDLSDSEDDFQPGEEIPGYDCHFLAFLVPKEKYEDEIDIYPILTDDPDYPVVEIAGGRLYPVEIDSILF